jgi:hypothetical protein
MIKTQLKLKDFRFETIRYNHSDFDGYSGEINVSLDYNNTNYFITGKKYSRFDKKDVIKELKQYIKNNFENLLSNLSPNKENENND